MNARPLLEALAEVFREVRLEVVLIGNAAAALGGAPVTTEDFDFMWRPTRANLRKLKEVAAVLGATLSRPEYPVSRFYRMENAGEGLFVDFMDVADGIRSFESLRSRATEVDFGGGGIWVADLADVIRSKRAAGRPKDVAVMPVLEEARRLKEGRSR